MGSGASGGAAVPTLPWPEGAKVVLRPGGALPDGLKTSGPLPATEDGVPFWRLGGPGKGRLRVVEDPAGLLELQEGFTVALCFRPAAGTQPGWDSLLLGHDNKHWLALPGDDKTKLCCLDSEKSADVSADFLDQGWIQLFLRSTERGTSLLGVDREGLLDLGTFPMSLAGSKLRNAGWAVNEVDIAAIALWDRVLTWSELDASPNSPPPPPALPGELAPKRIFGQVTDLKGEPLEGVSVRWKSGGCISDAEGNFEGILEDAETDVPEDASQASGSSNSSCVSFECSGFAPTSVCASPASDQSVRVSLRKLSATATLDASEGGSVVDSATGSSVTVPPESLVYADGSPVTGPVTVSLSVIDVTDPANLATMPGDFSAVGAGGESVMLESLGAAWIGATDEKGETLEVQKDSEGLKLDLHTTAKANAEKLGVVPEMWSFDTASGKWQLEAADLELDGEPAPNTSRQTAVETAREAREAESAPPRPRKTKKKAIPGSAKFDPEAVETTWMSAETFRQRLAKEGEKSLAAPVKKLGYWNIDMAYSTPNLAVMLTGLVTDKAGAPLVDAQLWAVGKSYYGRSPDTSGKDGRFEALMVQYDSEVDVEARYKKFLDSDKKLDVYFRGGKMPSSLRHSELKMIPGTYTFEEKATAPTWRKPANAHEPDCFISWTQERQRWQLMVEKKVLFVCPAEGPEGSIPLEGWRCAPLIEEEIPAPVIARKRTVMIETFGPFQTGPAGKFVDLGELKTGA